MDSSALWQLARYSRIFESARAERDALLLVTPAALAW